MSFKFFKFVSTMNFFQNNLTLYNFFILFFVMLIILTFKFNIQKAYWLWIFYFILFLMCATSYLPKYLVKKHENKNSIINPNLIDTSKTYYLHVLGAGYSLEKRLSATKQLSDVTLTRLIEAIRISKLLPNYIIVSSGYSSLGLESQASVVKRAAVELGIPKQNIEMLTTPSNTSEEVSAFVKRFGTNKNVIIVSNALHLSRAIMLYKKNGIVAIPAPTNFKVKQGINDYNGVTLPSISSIDLMNEYLREQLKYCKDSWQY